MSNSNLTTEQVAHLAGLARIDLSGEEAERLVTELGHIIDAVAQIDEAVGDDVPATSHPIPMTNVFREDVVRPSLGAQAALSGAPEQDEQRFSVPRILDEE